MPKETRSLTQERLGCRLGVDSEGDPLDDAAGDTPAPAVVELDRARVRMPDQVLDLFDRDVLGEQGGDDHDAKGVRCQVVGEPRGGEVALEHGSFPKPQWGVQINGCEKPP